MRLGKARKGLQRFAVVTAAMMVAAVVGIGLAAWTADGTGSGYAKAKTALALTTLDASAATVAQLYPGGTGDVKITINNPNSFAVSVSAINGNGSITASGGIGTCTTTGVAYTNQSGTWDVAANSSETFTLANAAAMTNASENGCQGAVFAIPVALSATTSG